MGINITLRNLQCLNQLKNGKTFLRNLGESTPNLVGNVGETVKLIYDLVFSYNSFAEVDEWNIGDGVIERTGGSFIIDGISEGDQFVFFNDWATAIINPDNAVTEFIGTITTVSSDGKRIEFNVDSLSQTTFGKVTNVGFAMRTREAENQHTAALIKFGLISNNEEFRFTNNVTDAQQVYYAREIDVVGTNPSQMVSLSNNKDWVTGLAIIFNSGSSSLYESVYRVSHEFVITPYWLSNWNQYLNTNTIPPLLAGNNSLKYSIESEFRKTLTNILSKKSVEFTQIKGVVGYFGENFNGFNNFYSVVDTVYTDAITGDILEGVNINSDTRVRVTVDKIEGTLGDFNAGMYISRLPANSEEYINTPTTYNENFLLDNIVAHFPSQSTEVGTGIFKTLELTQNGNSLTLDATLSYTFDEKLKLNEGDRYLIWCQIEDDTLSSGNSDRSAVLADWGAYTDFNYVGDFVNVAQYGFYTHEMNVDTDIPLIQVDNGRNESGIILKGKFGLDLSKQVVLNALGFSLTAYNPTNENSFNLDSFNIDLSSGTISNGIQEFNIQLGRGYELKQDDQFNVIKFYKAEKIGDIQYYEFLFPQKIRWQDWIRNDNVDTVFFDSAKPNENLNYKSSNYSAKQDYIIKLATNLTVSGVDDLGRNVTGDFDILEQGGTITAGEYSNNPDITGVIETVDPSSGAILGGAVLYNGQDTLMRATFTRVDPVPSVGYGIHRIEVNQSIGDGIFELSSIREFPSNNLLKPLAGESFLKVDNQGNTVITECLIDGSKIQNGIDYNLSAELQEAVASPCLQFAASNPSGITVSPANAGYWVHSGGISSLYCNNGREGVSGISACDAGVTGTVDLSSSEWTSLVYLCMDNANNLDLKLGDWINTEAVNISVQNAYWKKDDFEALITEIESVNSLNVIPNRVLNCGNVLVDLSQFPTLQARIDALIALGWNITIVNQKALSYTVGQNTLFNFNQKVSENSGQELWIRGNERLTGEVQTIVGDVIELYHSDISTIIEININDAGLTFLYIEEALNAIACTILAKRNLYKTQSINIIKSYLDQLITNGDNVDSLITVNINSLQVGDLYSHDDYYNNIVNYTNSDRLISYTLRFEKGSNYSQSYEDEGNYVINTTTISQLLLANDQCKGDFVDYENNYFLLDNNPELLTLKIYGQSVTRFDCNNTGLVTIDLINSIFNDSSIGLNTAPSLTSITFPSGNINRIFLYDSLVTSIVIDQATINTDQIRFINNNSLVSIDITTNCTLTSSLQAYNNDVLVSVNIPNVVITGSVSLYNNKLTDLAFNSGCSFTGNFFVFNNNFGATLDLTGLPFNLSGFRCQGNSNLIDVNVDSGSNLGSIVKDPQTTINYI